MAADDEVFPRGKLETGKFGKLAHEPRGSGQALLQCNRSDYRRGGDSALAPDQPDADPPLCRHAKPISKTLSQKPYEADMQAALPYGPLICA
jgi:hypothetical protein